MKYIVRFAFFLGPIADRFLVSNINQSQQAILSTNSKQEPFSFLKLALRLLLSKQADEVGGGGKKGAGGEHLKVQSFNCLTWIVD